MQLPLQFSQSFSYRGDQFVEHSGVRPVVDQLESCAPGVFRAFSVVGGRRAGKTHLSIFALERLLATGFKGTLCVAPDLRAVDLPTVDTALAVCIDDAQKILETDEGVGAFVALYEQVRQSSGVLVICSDTPLSSPNPHLQSRFAALTSLELGLPAREDVKPLLYALARQRGLKLTDREVSFLERRLGSGILEIELYVERLLELSKVTDGRISLDTLKDAI